MKIKKEKKVRGRPRLKIDKEELLRLRKKGLSIPKIAKKLNVSHSVVFRRLKELREPKVKKKKEKWRRRPRKRISKQKLLKLRREGKTMNEIGKELKISVGTVYNRLKEWGVE